MEKGVVLCPLPTLLLGGGVARYQHNGIQGLVGVVRKSVEVSDGSPKTGASLFVSYEERVVRWSSGDVMYLGLIPDILGLKD